MGREETEGRLIDIKNPEIVIAISAVVVAVAALGVSVWQGVLTRRHNRLSVTPVLRFSWDESLDQPSKLRLINSGLGPATIDKMFVKVDGKEIAGEYDPFYAAIQQLAIQAGRWKTYVPDEGEAIAVGEGITIIERLDIDSDTDHRKIIREALRRLEIKVFYRSIYRSLFFLKWEYLDTP